MTKKEARAIIACSEKIQKAVDSCLKQLSTSGELGYAEAYWAQHLRAIAQGAVYGSMPISRALEVGGQDHG